MGKLAYQEPSQKDAYLATNTVIEDGQTVHRQVVESPLYATKITAPDANTTYVAIAPIGSLQSAAVWQAKKILVSGNDTLITWAGGGAFNQVATDLTTLIYA